MPLLSKIGLTAITEPGRPAEGDKLGVSAVYRNVAAVDGLPETLDGAKTLYEVFESTVEMFADRRCLAWRPTLEDGSAAPFQYISFSETREKARAMASALSTHAGIAKGSKVGIYSTNNVPWMVTVRAVDVVSATVVPIYDSLGDSAVEYIIRHSELTTIVAEPSKLAALATLAPKLAGQVTTVVTTAEVTQEAGKAALEAIKRAGISVFVWEDFLEAGREQEVTATPPEADGVACIMYTSGTTGTPKGVMITHKAMVAGVSGAFTMFKQAGLSLSDDDSTLSYLPLAHIFGRIIEELALAAGASIGYWQGNVKLLMDDVAEFKPTLFIAVPRILERVCDAVEAKVAKGPPLARLAFNTAFRYKLFMLSQGAPHAISGMGVDQLIFSKVKDALGGRVRYIVSGGAPLAAHVEDVALAPVLQGYGLTETCAASFIMLPEPRMAHTVGPPLAPTELRFESVPELKYDATASPPQGEICIRGPMVFKGYYKDPEKTKAEFDDEGFFHTGDIGTLTVDGCLKIIDRKKNIFKLAQGEYVAVEYLESRYSRCDAVEQVWVYGNSLESALVAVVVPKPAFLAKFSGDAKSEEATQAMLEELTATGREARLKGFEMVKAVLLDEPFSIENDLMTPSMKLKRPQLLAKYKPQIDAMYAELKKR